MDQPRLFEFRMGERSPETLVLAEANRDAAKLLTEWRAWPNGALALVGATGAGKTHLALAWALESGARVIPKGSPPEEAAACFVEAGGRALLDDAEQAREDTLWRLLDLARGQAGAVLVVGSTDPARWPAAIPDLRSRLAALPVARLGEPDIHLMEVILRRFCREQFIQLSDDAVKYLAQRLPRTFAAARDLAAILDSDLAQGARPISRARAKAALQKAQARWGVGEV